jgi:hypothetical protein
MFFISGSHDTFNLSGGTETITDQGTGGDTFNLPRAGNGSASFSASVLQDGDVFGLTTILAATRWTGSSSSVGSFLHVIQSGRNTELLVSTTASRSAAGTLVATFDGEKVSLTTILQHSVT